MIAQALYRVTESLRRAADRRGLLEAPDWLALDRALRADHPRPADEPADPEHTGLRRIAAAFGLSRAESDLLFVSAAPDLDPNIARTIAVLEGLSVSSSPPSVALAMELAGWPVLDGWTRELVAETSTLRRWGLIRLLPGPLLLGRGTTVGEDVIAALLDAPVTDPVSAAMAERVLDPGWIQHADHHTTATELADALTAGVPLCWLEAPAGTAGADLAVAAFARADLAVVAFDLDRRPPDEPLLSAVTTLVRHSALVGSGLVLLSGELLRGDPDVLRAIAALQASPVPVVVVARSRWDPRWHARLPVVLHAQPLSTSARLAAWRQHLGPVTVAESVVSSYRLSPLQIASAAEHVRRQVALSDRPADQGMVTDAIRLLGGAPASRLGNIAGRADFTDLHVPAQTRATLDRLTSWVRLRDDVIARGRVHGVGGKGTGITAMFTGNPGTGKTLAAHVIADTVGLDLMHVDLAGVIDKYIGQTEKNLERIFAQAEDLNVVLFFDEADALFGSRSQVRDAHDRYANQEVSYLLQRMEQLNGITVLATNLRGNLDPAFARRLDFIVHFADPDAPTRRRILRQLLTHAGPLDTDDPVDETALAAAVELTGGGLRNIVLGACYDAAVEGGPIGQRHLVAAAIREFGKLGRRAPATLG